MSGLGAERWVEGAKGGQRERPGGGVLLLTLALAACRPAPMPGPAVCSERQACDGEQRCVLGRCREPGTQPVSTEAEQRVFRPVDIAWAPGPRSAAAHGPLPDPIALGRAGDGTTRLFLRFAADWPLDARVQRALLRLAPHRICKAQPGRLSVNVAAIEEPWSSRDVARGRRPRVGPPMRLAELGVTPPRPLLLDVTEMVRGWAEEPGRHHGLLLLSHGDSASGACVVTGDDRGPRLEVYLWPEDEDDDDEDDEDDEDDDDEDEDDEDDGDDG